MRRLSSILIGLVLLAGFPFALNGQAKQLVRVAPGYATVVICPSPPDLVTVGNMDAFSIQTAGTYILIKPLVSKGTTNMFIKAGADSYNLILTISESPDLEVRLAPAGPPSIEGLPSVNGKKSTENADETAKSAAAARRKPLSSINPKALGALVGLFKTIDRYTYSVNNSKIVFAIDHLKQIQDKLFIVGTIINESNVPYDIGFVRFKLVEYNRNYLFWKKKIKETELEPVNEYYNPTIKPRSSGRLLFIFDKHGFSENNIIQVKCNEENGHRDLVLDVPGSIIE
ncbi:conjugative transposon protein TraN [candidate division KSB1 bacterium]|nr:conjugative transposon protein TraN [candidate division KSB1 bacterium]